MSRFDLIVLGAGPAGSTAAAVAARAGLRVALIDKHAFPRDKLCGGGLTGRAMRYLADAFGEGAVQTPMLRRTRMQFHAFGVELSDIDPAPPIHLMMRREFDAALVQAALAAGATDRTGCAFVALDPEAASVTLERETVSAPILIAADGVNSPTAKTLFGAAFDRDEIGFALEVERPDAADDVPLRIDFGAADWGYGWQFPKTCGVTVGVGGVLRRNADMKARLRAYLDRLGLPDDRPIKGQFLPFGSARALPGKGPALLVGDAAGLVDPITGEGIAYAIRSGHLAAEAAIAALAAGRPQTALERYAGTSRPLRAAVAHARRLRPLLFSPRLRGAFVSGFARSTTLRSEYLRLLAGDTEYPQITQKVLWRLPRHAIRSLVGSNQAIAGNAP